jgi:tetratricopeptide (TPR) repeat protein
MILFNKKKILAKARDYLVQGLFTEGLFFLKKNRFSFFLIPASSSIKASFFLLYGAFLIYNDNSKKALAYLKKAYLNQSIDKNEALYFIIKAYINIYDHNNVKYYFNKLNERFNNLFFLIHSYYECKKKGFDVAVDMDIVLDNITNDDKNIYDILSRAILNLINNDYNSAYEIIIKYKDIYNNFYFYNLILLKILFNCRKYEEILNYMNDNIKLLCNYETLNIYSIVLYKLDLNDQSIKVLIQLCNIQRDNAKYFINIAKNYMKMQKYTSAIYYLKESLKNNKYINTAVFLLTVCLQKIGLFNDAFKLISKLEEKNKYYDYALFNMSLLYFDIMDYKNAKEIFKMINSNNIENNKYDRWFKLINSVDIKEKEKIKKIKYLIYLIPGIVILLSIIMIVSYIFIYR